MNETSANLYLSENAGELHITTAFFEARLHFNFKTGRLSFDIDGVLRDGEKPEAEDKPTE